MDAASQSERRALAAGCNAMGLRPDDAVLADLQRLLDELERWNRAYNLTAVRDRPSMVVRHLLDSLSVATRLHGHTVADVGTGAGFPGLPLAVMFPDRRFTLMDAVGKKIRFVERAARTLGLGNVEALHARVEDCSPAAGFDTVIGRAFAPAARFADSCRHLLAPGGRILMMKGRDPAEELAGLADDWTTATVALHVPGLDEARHLVTLTPRRAQHR